MNRPSDQAQRARAIDPAMSFIVQAPAGSGKTELLIQRYLALLSNVERPEEILAITFTRKAAGEMRERVLRTLERGRDPAPPTEPHRETTWRLARAVIERDATCEWGLVDSPSRLQIMTIDAFNSVLVRRLPLVSGVGGPVTIAEDSASLYEEAAREVLRSAGGRGRVGGVARSLLGHLDNDFGLAERHLGYLLARRDHWLPRVLAAAATGAGDRREMLESGLRREIERGLKRTLAAFPHELVGEWVELAAYAAGRLAETKPDHAIRACADLTDLPPVDAACVGQWRGLADLLLVAAGGWRKRLDKNCGFPPDDPPRKARMGELLDAVRGDAALNALLNDVRRLPPAVFDDGQWRMLEEMLALLPICAGELALACRRGGQLDYVALAQHARGALGSSEAPTDLALALDYRIRHILVDEFQDVSAAQVELLEMLTAGWTDGDGRTLFCVGDPMQSIYRFREAEVALYLHAREHGLGSLHLEPLTLEMNFRSRGGLAEWFNELFAGVFPDAGEPRLGAVSYAPSTAVRPPGPAPAVTFAAAPNGDPEAEAVAVAERIESIRRSSPDAGIAVLVRARGHLTAIAPELRRRGLDYQAVEIEPLARRQAIQDLLALTRAVCHLADRTAWLAVLRAPWCGLRLDELERLGADRTGTVWASLSDGRLRAALGDDANRRLGPVREALAAALAERGRRPLHRLVEGLWLQLGGPATLPDASSLVDARQFFELLARLEVAGDLADVAALESQLDKLYAAPDVDAGNGLQLMTIHKAKGLEFDHVILPGLDRRPRGSTRPLLYWQELIRDGGRSDLLLAPVEAKGADPDPLQAYIASLEKQRDRFELQRLLYVAATRARERLHLVTCLPRQDEDEAFRAPTAGTMLALLWPTLADAFVAGAVAPTTSSARPGSPVIRRLTAGWQRPPPDEELVRVAAPLNVADDPDAEGVRFDWAGQVVRIVGTVAHRYFERIADEGVGRWDARRLEGERPRIESLLAEGGVPSDSLAGAVSQVVLALSMTLADEDGRRILSGTVTGGRSEMPVAGQIDGQVTRRRIDRCYLDDEGVRWIVDFKISPHDGGADLERFFADQKTRYCGQLEVYARLLAQLYPEEKQRRVGLYFALQGAFRSWTPACGAEAPPG